MKRYSSAISFFIFITCFAQRLYAQFNDSVHYYSKYATTGIINKTNQNRSFVLNNVFAFSVNKKEIALNSSASWMYGKQNGSLTNNDFTTGLNVDLHKNTRKLYYWGLVNLTSSYSLNIRHQFQGGGGIGYNFVNKPNIEVVVSDGLLYERSSLKIDSVTNENYQTIRNSLRLRHRWVINNIITWDGMHFWQPSLLKFDDYIIRSTSNISIRLKKWLSFTSSLTYNKVSRTNRENLLLSFGITAETYF
ncbi:DUF481 domain-containing protein [Terrimonas sp.]|uniref:DUF481 domain-containing protein n=1 Tax=Terrimonas sp. TaxID=1914338 RepID=UPI001F0C8B84|nr:DUF481 domain-containing protein [Terrimonas sp.]